MTCMNMLFRKLKSQVKYNPPAFTRCWCAANWQLFKLDMAKSQQIFLHNPGNLYAIIKCLTLIKSSLSQLSKDIWYVWICCLEIKNHRSNTPQHSHAADVLQIDNYSNWIWPNRNRYFLHNPGNLYAIIKCLTLIKSSLSQLSKDMICMNMLFRN